MSSNENAQKEGAMTIHDQGKVVLKEQAAGHQGSHTKGHLGDQEMGRHGDHENGHHGDHEKGNHGDHQKCHHGEPAKIIPLKAQPGEGKALTANPFANHVASTSVKGKRRRAKKTVSQVILQAVLIGFAFIQLFPLYWLLTFSFKNNAEIFAGNILGLPEKLRFENYAAALHNGDVLLYFFNSAFVTLVSVSLACFFGAMASYGIMRMRWKLAVPVLNLFLLGTMIPLHAVLLPLFLSLNKVGLLNSYMALILPYTAFALPMAIFIFTGFLETIPKEMEEAACIDGCGIYRTFLLIIMPLLKPAIATVSIFTFLSTWNELMFATTFITDRQFKTLTVGIMSFVSQYRTNWGPIGASLVIAVIPMILIYALMSKQIQESFRAGSTKG